MSYQSYPPKMMSATSAARYLDISELHFRNAVRPALRAIRIGRSVRFYREDIDAYVEKLSQRETNVEQGEDPVSNVISLDDILCF